MIPNPQDQRKFKRLPVKMIASLRRLIGESESAFTEGQVSDISMGGVFIEIKTPFAQGDVIAFEMRIPQNNQKIDMTGIIRWVSEQSPQGIGVELLKTTSNNRKKLKQFVKDRESTRSSSRIKRNPPVGQ